MKLITMFLLLLVCSTSFADDNVQVSVQGSALPACAALENNLVSNSARVLSVVRPDSQLCILARGFKWAEGPLWVDQIERLLFSDIPAGKVYQYIPGIGVSTYLETSGYSNGLVLSNSQQLVLLQSRERKVSVMQAELDNAQPEYKTLAAHYDNKRLNSPNDGVFDASGGLYFTDPPYGLPDGINDKDKALSFQGVYYLASSGRLSVIDKTLSLPNGIALSPNGEFLYVAVSDPEHKAWYRYALDGKGSVQSRELFFEVPQNNTGKGLPDGMAFHENGLLFASGPGGVWIFNEDGDCLGRIFIDDIVSNLAFDSKGEELYLTVNQSLMKIGLVQNK